MAGRAKGWESERCNTENKHKGNVIMNVKLQRQKAERAENSIPEDQHQIVNEENDRIGGGTGGEVESSFVTTVRLFSQRDGEGKEEADENIRIITFFLF